MKTVIMAGGLGTRLKNITGDRPKALAPVGGIPVIEHQIKLLASYGLKDIIVSTGYLGEKIHSFCGNGSRWEVNISYSHETNPIGIAGAMKMLRPKLKDDFILLNVDLMIDMNLNKLISTHFKYRPIGTIVVQPSDHPHESCLVETDDDNWLTRWVPKKDRPEGDYPNLANTGAHLFSPKIFSYINPENKDFDSEVIPKILRAGEKILAYRTSEYLQDIGTEDRYHKTNVHFRSGLISARNLVKPQKAIFLDRDGTINTYMDGKYVTHPDQMKLISGTTTAISKINNSDYLAICITNQGVIARNLCDLATLKLIHNRMETLLGHKGAYLNDIYFCPHYPEAGDSKEINEFKIVCQCRKPAPGMVLKAKEKYNLDLNQCLMIGDTDRDIMTAKNTGMKSILIHSSYLKKYVGPKPDLICDNLDEAVNTIFGKN